MKIKQWEDKGLSIYSYAILSECENKIILIDPERDISKYEEFAKETNAIISGVIETHPHADYVSGHLELHRKHGAEIYVHKLVNALYPHTAVEHNDIISLGKIKLQILHTPGHSPDSICILLNHNEKQHAIFTGDTLFIGDCGRPDLREEAGFVTAGRNELAGKMYDSLNNIIARLPDELIVYPGHGAGSLCGKGLGSENSSTIGKEKITNWALHPILKEEFISKLLNGQPIIPAYFPHTVMVNRNGADDFSSAVSKAPQFPVIRNASDADRLNKNMLIIDGRDSKLFKAGHLKGSVNIMEGNKFETWLGTIIHPGEKFYLTAKNSAQLERLIRRIVYIGYENQLEGAFLLDYVNEAEPELNIKDFKENINNYTILDIRNPEEVNSGKSFETAVNMPLGLLNSSLSNIPLEKPVVVHCAAGYRSAIGTSLIKARMNGKYKVYDLGKAIGQFLD